MDASNLDELKEKFEVKIEGLTRCINLSSAVLTPDGLDENCKKQLVAIHTELCLVESLIGQMRDLVDLEKQHLQRAQVLKSKMEDQAEHIQYIESHIPDRLPGRDLKAFTAVQSKSRAPLEVVENNKGNHGNHGTQRKPCSKDNDVIKDAKKKKASIPTMEFVTVEEFEGVPKMMAYALQARCQHRPMCIKGIMILSKYMKGRLNYETINTAVEIINIAIRTRYSLLQKPRNTLSEMSLKKVRQLREQENKDTKGVYFFTEEDFKSSSNGRCSTTARSIFTILRHCGRLREIRSSGLTRYALVL